ncbi:DUF1761 domain-containing protein [Nonomuraea sp. NN258]|uniref:DUF1761 domain-containing protein n=1 Tax=Nonomuraea antri TaxID=2730852 RepID=UPI001569F2FB|nr:DUF1761 domain-containing protein [Nonomuraea antri]NRQ38052.1 DUF1761 domain-containing protein [Nonomuraea antri]
MGSVISVVVASIAAFVLSSTYYALLTPAEKRRLGEAAPDRGDRPPPLKILLELARSLVVATVIMGLARYAGLTGVGQALVLGLVLWAGFPAMLLTGSMMWERTPAVTAVLHAGDWLLKLLIISAIVGAWL